MHNPPVLVQDLFYKPAHGQPLLAAADGLECERGYGIRGDSNADPISPRQVLVTRQEDLHDFSLVPGYLRENIVLSGIPAALFVPGARLWLGEAAAVRLTFHCEPCAQIADRVSLRAILGRRGLLGVVVASGTVAVGDAVSIEPGSYAPLPEKPMLRFWELLQQVPAGRVATSLQLLRAMGVQTSYARALPGYLRQAPAEAPVHRLVDAQGRLLRAHLPLQAEALAAEGVLCQQGQVSLTQFGWQPGALHLQ